MLTLNNVRVGYGQKTILTDVSLSITANEIVGIMGGNGSGKTTLLKSISCGIPLLDGEYLLDGKDISTYSNRERAKKISYLPQKNGIVYSIAVLDVVLMGVTPYLSLFGVPSAGQKQEAAQLLEQSGIGQLQDKNFLELSEGQKQLVLIAKNLMQKSALMIFDEPSASLDFNNTYFFMDTITKVIRAHEKSAIITIHDPNLALLYCDKIVALKDGGVFDTLIMKDVSLADVERVFGALYDGISVMRHGNNFYVIKENAHDL